jgi:hypothetical protein
MEYCIKKNTGAFFQGMTGSHLPMFGPFEQCAIFPTAMTARNVINEYKLQGCDVLKKDEVGSIS